MHIREAKKTELKDVLAVESAAFDSVEEAELVNDLLHDPSAEPVLNLLAFENDRAVGHILFTRARLEPESSESVALLAPLAVVPDSQGKGIGGQLIRHGLKCLSESGVDIVFVLGHPGYYPRHGFTPAGKHGYNAPYPIPEKDSDAWMFQRLNQTETGNYTGTVTVAEKLRKPEYWRE
jgi:putative acetyltransferase